MAWHEGQTCEEYDSDIDGVLVESWQQMTPQEREEAKGKKGLEPPWIHHQVTRLGREAARQEAARQEAARQEAARQEAARQEAARQEAARQEAMARREETRRQEAERQKALADAEALKRKHAADNKASLATVKIIAKTCPNKGCGAHIQKINGCDHMTCKSLRPFRPSADRPQAPNAISTSAGPLFKCTLTVVIID
jgi:uncharacterized membrane protein YqiK